MKYQDKCPMCRVSLGGGGAGEERANTLVGGEGADAEPWEMVPMAPLAPLLLGGGGLGEEYGGGPEAEDLSAVSAGYFDDGGRRPAAPVHPAGGDSNGGDVGADGEVSERASAAEVVPPTTPPTEELGVATAVSASTEAIEVSE